jgi:hypothetical protein
MDRFPRTIVGGLSVSRMIIGTNQFVGCSHCTAARDAFLVENVKDRKKIADIIEVFFKNGIDTVMGEPIVHPVQYEAIREAQERTGVKAIIIGTPGFNVTPTTPVNGFDTGAVERTIENYAKYGIDFCLPHQGTTDSMVDRCTRSIRQMDKICEMIRKYNIIPGLSTHMPESIIYADESGLDVETYISIYNAMGFLMQIEVDWVAKIINEAKKPVMCIKPMAAGQLRPFQALNFIWNTIRDKDMVVIGTASPKEAEECIEISSGILERRQTSVMLQETRSKKSVKKQ